MMGLATAAVHSMVDIFKNFDTYSLKARVFPALIAGLPTLALLFIIVPWDHLSLSQTISASMGLVLIFAFADMARNRGKYIQAKLGTGETPEQWHRGNADIPEGSKDRFRIFVANQLKQNTPSADEEKADPNRANDFYRSAGAWLRDRTRDTRAFPILFGENITYGFRRNLLGLKSTALVCNILVLAFCTGIIYIRPRYFMSLTQIEEKLIIVIAAVLLHSAYMVFAVSKYAVRDASRAYGRQLILSCDTLMKPPRAVSPKKEVKSNASR
ncbi:hypothetical protein [Methylobacterium sp. Leaf469]|uniref:hypothetical protein n=1 Tax=Methylobacterium sp. Leaf469 TaxID=1736387 RepID=UPI0012E3CBC9|nr:hypothetical protein [Methylobacterium sp. Leaf469]